MTSKSWMGSVVLLMLGGGVAVAQVAAPKGAAPKAAPAASSAQSTTGHGMMGMGQGQGQGMMGQGMMGQGMMGQGMMGQGMMGQGMMESCSCANTAGVRVEVKKVAKGVTVTYTSDDANTVARIQKRADAVRLMHESCAQ